MSRTVYWTGSVLASLYGHWLFDEDSGTRFRLSGTAPNLSESGGTIYAATGKYGKAISGTEADTFSLQATLSPVLAMSSGLSFAFWFKWPASPSLSAGTMFTLSDTGTSDYINVDRFYDSNYLNVGFRWALGQSISLPLPRLGAFAVDTWHLLIVTYNATTGVLTGMVDAGCMEDAAEWATGDTVAYKLSETVPAAQLSAANATTFDTVKFLKAFSGSFVNFEGQIDDPGIWTKALSDTETEQLYVGLEVTKTQAYEKIVQEDLNVGTDMVWATAPGGGDLRATQLGLHTFARNQKQSQTTWTPGTITAGSYTDTNVSVTGAVIGDFVMVSHTKILTNALRLVGHCQEPGNVKVVVHNPTASSVTVASGTLNVLVFTAVNQSGTPTASFTYAADEGGISGEGIIQFTDATSGGVTPYTYAWDFGDGNTDTTQSPSHTYSQGGGANPQTFTVVLTVTDDLGAVDSDTQSVTVTFNP